MKIYRYLIVEDSPLDVDTLKSYMDRLPLFMASHVCSTVGEALGLIKQYTFDLIFLDMHLSDQSGIDLLQSLTGPHLPVIVISAHDNYAVECYDLNVADYLRKPFSIQRLMRSINRTLPIQVSLNHFAEQDGILLKSGRCVQRFLYEQISYVEAIGSHCKISGNNKVDLVNDTISNLEVTLPKQWFVRIHKSFIINIDKITGYSNRYVSIGSLQIPIGGIYKERFQGFLNMLNKTYEEN